MMWADAVPHAVIWAWHMASVLGSLGDALT